MIFTIFRYVFLGWYAQKEFRRSPAIFCRNVFRFFFFVGLFWLAVRLWLG